MTIFLIYYEVEISKPQKADTRFFNIYIHALKKKLGRICQNVHSDLSMQ